MLHFTISNEKEACLKEWQNNHECKFRVSGGWRYVGSIGGADTFKFIPTSIGDVITVVECACGARIDITETDSMI